MLMPKRAKYRRKMRGKNRGKSNRGNELSFGEFGLKALERGFVTSRQLESARKAIGGTTKRGGKIWIRVFPDKPMTKKPLEVRMGSGKGNVEYYCAVIKPGRVLFEIAGVDKVMVEDAFKKAAAKLPVKTKMISEAE